MVRDGKHGDVIKVTRAAVTQTEITARTGGHTSEYVAASPSFLLLHSSFLRQPLAVFVYVRCVTAMLCKQQSCTQEAEVLAALVSSNHATLARYLLLSVLPCVHSYPCITSVLR